MLEIETLVIVILILVCVPGCKASNKGGKLKQQQQAGVGCSSINPYTAWLLCMAVASCYSNIPQLHCMPKLALRTSVTKPPVLCNTDC